MHATGLKDVAADAAVPIGSLYFHFPGGKQDLVLAALESSGNFIDSVMEQIFTTSPTFRDALRSYIELTATMLDGNDYRSGCPLATTALEIGAENDDVARQIAASFASWTRRVEDRLRIDGFHDPASLAVLVVAAVEGALLLSRVNRSAQPLRTVGDALDAVVANATTAAGRPG